MPKSKEQKRIEARERQAVHDLRYHESTIRTTPALEDRLRCLSPAVRDAMLPTIEAARKSVEEREEMLRRSYRSRGV